MTPPTQYRSSNLIIQILLEGIIRADQNNNLIEKGIIKSHLVKYAGLKATTSEKYFEKMEKAGYIEAHEENWGERKIKIYKITALGRQRYEWFVKINSEIE